MSGLAIRAGLDAGMEELLRSSTRGVMERPECESRRDAPTWLGLSETEKAGGRTGNPCYSDSPRTGMEDRGERAGWEEWNGWDASLGETRPRGSVSPRPRKRVEGRAILAIPTVLEPGWKIEANGGTGRPGTVGMRVSERRAHVAQSLRDRESGWKDGQSLLFRQSSNRDGRSRRTGGLGGMERLGC